MFSGCFLGQLMSSGDGGTDSGEGTGCPVGRSRSRADLRSVVRGALRVRRELASGDVVQACTRPHHAVVRGPDSFEEANRTVRNGRGSARGSARSRQEQARSLPHGGERCKSGVVHVWCRREQVMSAQRVRAAVDVRDHGPRGAA